MEAEGVVEYLSFSLPESVTARRFASAALECSELADHYPAGFAAQLAGGPTAEEPSRTVSAWAVEASPFLNGADDPSAEQLFFAAVLFSEPVASEFRRLRPTGSGFERRCKEFIDGLDHEQKEAWDRLVGASLSPQDRQMHPAMAKAIDRDEAEFTQLAEVRTYQQPRFNKVDGEREVYARFYPLVREAFEHKHGRVTDEYWCHSVEAGVVRTERGSRIYFDGNFGDRADVVVNRCADLRQRSAEFLTGREYADMVSTLYLLLTNLLSDLDGAACEAKRHDLSDEQLVAYTQRVEAVEQRAEERIARRGQRWYVAGTGLGLALLAMVMAPLISFDLGDWSKLFEGAIFGAAGSIASVLLRMHRDDLQVDASHGKRLVYTAATVRPLMGALFGAIVIAIALSGLLPIDVPAEDPQRFYFLGVFAFGAGFSERWAPDLLEMTTTQISSSASTRNGTGTS